MNTRKYDILGVITCFLAIMLFVDLPAFAVSPIISEQYIIIFDLSGTFVKNPENIRNSIDKIRRFAEDVEAVKEQFRRDASNEMRGRRFAVPEVNVEFTITGMGSYPNVIWSGSITKFLELSRGGEIYRLVQNTVQDAKLNRIRNNSKCTDIQGALETGFRRLKSKKPDRELIIRAGVIMFSDLLNDPPDSTGRCSNRNDPNPPEGDVWDTLTAYLEDNKDRANSPPVFYPKFSFIALGMTEQPNKAIDPASLWTEKLVSFQPESNPFDLEFHSFSDAINYSIPVPPGITITEIHNYLDNFDIMDGRRMQEAPRSQSGKDNGGSNFLKIFLIVILGFAVLIFSIIALIILGVIVFVYLRRRRQNQRPA